MLSTVTNFDLNTRRTACGWFERAATNGLARAQMKMGLSYEHDWLKQGADPLEALAWYKMAAERGHRGARIRAENLEKVLSAEQRAQSNTRHATLRARVRETTTQERPGENLLPTTITGKHDELLRDAGPVPHRRPRTIAEARMAGAQSTNQFGGTRRDDLYTGLLKTYLDDLQERVRTLANERLAQTSERDLLVTSSRPQDMEIIISYRILSDGHVEDVEVLDTNLPEREARLFIIAMEDCSPTPRWTPPLRAELSDEDLDLLLAFGRKSVLRIAQ